ncbi:hypothetical protein O3G_MSEX013736 [Manduca sexta]|uniref:DnaJ homolog subfamily C member 10 n=1 Tax=Manduca sexta TaxID=7130 RepID=A0A922CYE0_MANSE|nr:hypothetical protein O3G_MSEX013736 [Manduca sexta]
MFKAIAVVFLLIGAVNLTDVTFYEILGVSKQASTQEIRQAYKKLAIKYHPDKNPGEAEQEKFLRITEAYETLKDPEKRRNYDIYGSYPSYSKKYDYKSQSEYDNLYYNGLYHNDPFVDTLSGASFYNYLNEGFYFINFYSPFCPPCQNVADHWKKLAEMYKGIIKIAAVNCKYHNSFCYNSMRIGSYPSLLFYPNGRNGNFIYYRGDRTLEALDQFIMSYIKSKIHVPTVTQLRNTDKPFAYVLGNNRVERNALIRIAYHLDGIVTVAVVEIDNLREKLTNNEYTTVVFKHKSITKEIESMDEKIIVKEIVDALPGIDKIDPEKLKDIRNQLRRGSKTPWVLYFSAKGHDKLELHQMKNAFPDVMFGEVDCEQWSELCLSLQAIAPAWGALKRGGAYQLAHTSPRRFITTDIHAISLHTLSASDLNKILDGVMGLWVLLVVPYKLSWEQLADPFTRASLHYNGDGINFGIMTCTLDTDKYCRQVAHSEPTILVQNGTKQNIYKGQVEEKKLLEYIRMLRNSVDLELDEEKVLEILDPSGREHSWLVAFLPANCGAFCDELMHELMLAADKVRSVI